MADLRTQDEFGKKEGEFATWVVGWDAIADAISPAPRREYVKLNRIKRDKLKLLERKETNCRKRKQARLHNKSHDRNSMIR